MSTVKAFKHSSIQACGGSDSSRLRGLCVLLQMGFIQGSDGVWLLTVLESMPSLSPSRPFLLLLPLSQHLSFVVSAERVVSVPIVGALSIEDYFKVHNDAALIEVRLREPCYWYP